MMPRANLVVVVANDDSPTERVDVLLSPKAGTVEFAGQPTQLVAGARLTAGAARVEAKGSRTTINPGEEEPARVAEMAEESDILSMTSPVSREELAAELRAVNSGMAAMESRIDTRIAEVRTDVRLVLGRIEQFSATLGDVRKDNAFIREDVRSLRGEMDKVREDVRSENRSTRSTIIVTAITSLLAVLGLGYMMQQSLLAAFQSGMSVKATLQAPPTTAAAPQPAPPASAQ